MMGPAGSVLAIVCELALTAAAGSAGAAEPVFPGVEWQSRSPGELRLDPAKLKAFTDFAGGRGCVTRDGYMAYAWGDPARSGDVASACKPFFAHFLFKAVEDGKLPGLDEKVVRYEPRLGQINAALDHKDAKITWRHLATQTSCYQLAERPGSAYCYNDSQMALFWDLLFLKVYRTDYGTVDARVFRPLLTDPIGCQDAPSMMAFGVRDRPGRVTISPRDFCRFGLLYMRQGRWNGRQLLKEDFAVAAVSSPLPADLPRAGTRSAEMLPGQRSLGSTQKPDNQCPHQGSYSYLWWINGTDEQGKRLWPGVPDDAYGAFGHGGPRAMAVIPSLGLVVSWNDARLTGWEQVGRALAILVDSATDARPAAPTAAAGARTIPGKPLPGQLVADPANPAWLVRFSPDGEHKPFFMCGPGDPEGFLYRGTLRPDGTRDGDQIKLIEKLKPTGANCIYLMAVRSHGGDGGSTENPFVDHDPAKPLNDKLLDQWETWFAAMDEAGIVIYFFLYDDGALIWNTGDAVGPQEKAFLTALVNRFKHHRNLVWCIAEEYQERFSARRVSAIAAAIRAADEHAHPIAVHKLSGLGFAEFADDPNIEQFAMQYNARTIEQLHDGMVQAFRDAAGRYSLNMSEIAYGGIGTGEWARRKMWAMAMGGATLMINGMDIATTAESDLADCGRMVRFFESAGVNRLSPHDELAGGGTQYVLARPNESWIAYSGGHHGRLGLKGLPAGAYDLTWMDCATGKTVVQPALKVQGGDQEWAVPDGLRAEIVLWVRPAAAK